MNILIGLMTEDIPAFIKANRKKYAFTTNRDPANRNFIDGDEVISEYPESYSEDYITRVMLEWS